MALPLRYNLRNVRQRWKTSVLAVVGVALVVAVLVVLVAMSDGFRRTLAATGSADNAIVIQQGATSELTSGLRVDDVDFITADRRVARDDTGRPLASREMVVVANLQQTGGGPSVNVLVRGVTPRAFEVRRGIRFVAGRAFTPGLSEIVVGRRLLGRYEGLQIGGRLKLARREWHVVGVFEAGGGGFESEIWGDAHVMRQAFHRETSWQALTLRMTDPRGVEDFAGELGRNPRMQVQLRPERVFYEEQAGPTAGLLLALAGFVSVVMGIGAIFGAMNTMYGLVAARTREIGTLRALGFSRRAVLASFLIESLLLALAGGLLGILLALPFDGLDWATGNNFSEVAFAFRISRRGITTGLVFAAAMGLLGGLLPALRAARLPIVEALREA